MRVPKFKPFAMRALRELKLTALALPIFTGRDIMYLWATHRLRRKPWKVFFWVLLLGALCWCAQYSGDRWAAPFLKALLNELNPATLQGAFLDAVRYFILAFDVILCFLLIPWGWARLRNRPAHLLTFHVAVALVGLLIYWIGNQYATPWLLNLAQGLGTNFPSQVLLLTIGSLFSSLNVLSCLSLVVVARSLRHLNLEGHIEHLMLAPGRFRPSALFYAIGLRYIPLAFAAILVVYLTPKRTPFEAFPFDPKMYFAAWGNARAEAVFLDPRVLRWAALHEISVLAFCAANLLMDIAVGYWIYLRWRPSVAAIAVAILLVGLIEPPIIMTIHELVAAYYDRHTMEVFLESATPRKAQATLHYSINAALSLGVTWALLRNLDARWNRMLDDKKCDPVFLK